MTQIIRYSIIIVFSSILFSSNISYSFKNEISIGYDDNFMRFSQFEMDRSYLDNGTNNDYLGDAKTYDSSIISVAGQLTLSTKIFKSYKTNFIFKSKYNKYSSSDLKSYSSLLGRFEFKLAPYSWIKVSYSILPRYYLRTYIDRDLDPLSYYPCYFSNEKFYISYSHKIGLDKTWLDYRFIINNQFYNKNFTEYDSMIKGFETTLKSKFAKDYYISFTYAYHLSDNISYKKNLFESTKLDRSYVKNGFKFYLKQSIKNELISSIGFKFYFDQRFYDLDSWYYNSDNWKIYSDYDLRLELSKKINKNIDYQFSIRRFLRSVSSSESDELSWLEDYKNYNRNELWVKFIYKF